MSEPTTAPSRVVQPSPLGAGAAVTAVLMWGFGNVLIADVPLNAFALSFYRLGLGALIYLVILYARGGGLSMRSLRYGWKGGVSFGLDIAAFFAAVKLTTVANAVTISALQPIVILLFGVARFGERVTRRHMVCTALSILGVAVVMYGADQATGETNVWGIVMAFIATIMWGWYFVASKEARAHLDTMEYQTVLNGIGFLVVVPIALVAGSLGGADGTLDGSTIWWVALVVAIPGTGHIIMNWAHNHTTILLASLATLLMPVVSTALAAVWLGQAVNALQWTGVAIVLGAVAAVIVGDARDARVGAAVSP